MQHYLKFDSPVHNLQIFLRTISMHYPAVPLVIPDGIYGIQTEKAVKAFQKEMSIDPDGITDNSTWDLIVETYKEIIIENSGGRRVSIFPENGLYEDHHSFYPTVIIMQSMMYALSQIFDNIPEPSVNGEIDDKTIQTIKAVQRACGLNPDGNITVTFWNFLSGIYEVFVSADRVSNSSLT